MKPKFSDLWLWDGTIGRGAYLFWGLLLFAIKFNLDRAIGGLCFGLPWRIFDEGTLRLYLWQSPLPAMPRRYWLSLAAISLPFLWSGTILTLRRLRSIGWRPWWVLLFFVPVLKLIFFAVLCLLPERDPSEPWPSPGKPRWLDGVIPQSAWGSAAMAVFITAMLAVGAAWLGTSVFRDYGWTIFMGLPFAMGFLSVLLYSYHEPHSLGRCLIVAQGTVVLAGAALLVFAIEGAICVAMAAALSLIIATIGALIGYAIQKTFWRRTDSSRLFCTLILAVPVVMGVEHSVPPPLPLLEVKSSVIVDAPPEQVWRHVIEFSELPPPRELIFKLGVAYPIRAEIYGRGVGAVRHCRFSTGPFVEPIEVWDEPRLLKFSVTKNPEPMQEWTPYRSIHPAHLDGYLESRAGQFRLVALPGGRTRLEGTTWYYHRLWPAAYWQFWSDHIIHTIHLRVLNHVKQLSERKDA